MVRCGGRVIAAANITVVIAWANLVFAATACGVNVWAARRGPGVLRPLRAAVAALAAVFVAAYVWLLSDLDAGLNWSQWMRPVGLVAWGLVWILPPCIVHRASARVAAHLDSKADEIKDAP